MMRAFASRQSRETNQELTMTAPAHKTPAPAARYHLRFTLTPAGYRQETRALMEVIRRGQIDEVAFFVPHGEETSLGLGTAAENRRMVERLKPVFAQLRRHGVTPSLNIWWTVAFSSFPGQARRFRHRFRSAINLNGQPSAVVACPRDEAWRRQVGRMYAVFAALRPARLWIDDDVRMTLRADMQCPCVCEVCLGDLARRLGRPVDRSAFLTAFMADPPNPVREAWLDSLEELEREIVCLLASMVHRISPETHVGLMYSMPEQHWAEGRRWADLVAALGQPTPYSRPVIGPYTEVGAADQASALVNCRLSVAALPPTVTHATEIENYPHSRFAKSARNVRLDLLMGQLMGIREATLNIFRGGGRLDLELRRESIWPELLADTKPRLQALAALNIEPGQAQGVGCFFHEQIGRHVRDAGERGRPIMIYRERPLDAALPLLGIATTYGTAPVTQLSGELPACLEDEQIPTLLSRGVVLDARAAETFIRLGHGALIGLKRRIKDAPSVIETVEDPDFGDYRGDPMNLRWDGPVWQFALRAGARPLSAVRDYTGKRTGHGVIVFENQLGGRIVIYPFDSQFAGAYNMGIAVRPFISASFLGWTRQAQMRAALEWAGRNPLPLFVPRAPSVYPLLIRQPNRLIVGVANLNPDPIPGLELLVDRLPGPAPRIRVLTPDGAWRKVAAPLTRFKNGSALIATGIPLAHLEVAVLRIDG
jgi:hypothetical protein